MVRSPIPFTVPEALNKSYNYEISKIYVVSALVRSPKERGGVEEFLSVGVLGMVENLLSRF